MSCAMGADAGMVASQVAQFAPRDIRDLVLSKLESGEWIGKTGQFFTERTGGSDLGALETTATPDGDDQPGAPRRRHDGPRLRPARAGGVALLCKGTQFMEEALDRPSADAPKVGGHDRGRGGRAGDHLRRIRAPE